MIIESDYTIRIVPFPTNATGGVTATNDDGTYSVYLNANLPVERQKEALAHELKHIVCEDFYRETDIDNLEGAVQ